MKIDRLLGIITVLLQRQKVTAPELAAEFEVSRRTIQRDIDDICKAGIPVMTFQGGDGGISIAEGYKLDKTVISVEELQHIVAGLKSIGSVSDSQDIGRLIMKLSPKEGKLPLTENVLIDLASHYKDSLSDKITIIKSAISQKRLIRFDYYSEKGVSKRLIEPYLLTFKWSAWYVYGYCTGKKDFRLFKLNRLWWQELTDTSFEAKSISAEKLKFDEYFQDKIMLTVLFDKSIEYLLVEEYGPDCYQMTAEGKLKFSVGFTNKEHMYRWILSFGDKAEVLEPLAVRNEIGRISKNLASIYEHDI